MSANTTATPPPSPDKGWIPKDWRTRIVIGTVGLVGAALIATLSVVLPRVLDGAEAGPHRPTDLSAPFDTKVMETGRAPTRAYALSAGELASDPRVNALITSGSRPENATPIDERRDSWALRASGSDPVTILAITAVGVTSDLPQDNVYIEYGQGGQGGGDDPPPEVYGLAVDLASGDALTATGEPFFDAKKIVLRDDRSTFLDFSFRTPEARNYTWILHFDIETSDGELLDIYAGPSGELHTDKADIPSTDHFTLTGRADSYATSYLPGADGLPELPAAESGPVAAAGGASPVPAELAGHWCPKTGSADCIDFDTFMRVHPQATFSSSTEDATGATAYSICLNGPADCVTASMKYLEYFPAGVPWDCPSVGNREPWKGCLPDYTADHDTAQVRLVIRPNHQQGEYYADSPPLYRVGG